ncbi:RNA-directed DNA polymerase and maturase, group II intron origin [Syntrophotalea carbinolica DSM 2380]|uniref:RNA-directed DNA polymerase and maturase, group II intron origin n=1 Tax=Syntrophotalea carbinolica (strain DSM 2380 / NBRC 103641 / GraBd1) TaxID=338963 RepID=Q3A299_SYNC1|nr:group II intron reverse transcriptase/maturase [Syntrophotalea carbinolica]ABA89508.1 RNA-directed DNA polymerase and maturase, group II intron origin [Syntrophotalea carbinolica DSM 2380]
MLTTPGNIRKLQRKLYRKAKQEPACRFHALYDKVYRADILSHAYALVRANKGSAGIDGVTFAAIEEREGVSALIAELEEALRSKTYKPDPVKRVMIPKADGSQRPLGIPTIRDRVAQMAVKLVVEPIFEADFCDTSYGFRPKKSAHDAVDDVAYAMNIGYTEVIDADISKYFDTIPHTNLMAVVAERICDGAILHLIQMWLKSSVMEVGKDGKKRNVGGGKGNRRGTPQGGVISPLLANLYLHILDRIWERRNLQQRLNARIVRYADDTVLLCRRNKSDEAMAVLRQILERLGLTLNEAKTKVVNGYKGGFDFLGFSIRMGKSRRTGNYYPHVQPSKKSLQVIKDRVTKLTNRVRTVRPLAWVVNEVNATVRGWVGYFHYRNCSKTMTRLKSHVEERLRTHLRKRHKVRERKAGYVLFPIGTLYKSVPCTRCRRQRAGQMRMPRGE